MIDSNSKYYKYRHLIIFFFHFTIYGGLMYLGLDEDESIKSLLVSTTIYSMLMTWFLSTQMVEKEIYLKPGMRAEVEQYITDHGYVVKKQNDNTTYFKSSNFNNPLRSIYVKQSSYYTLLRAPHTIIENLPSPFKSIR